MSRHCTQTWIYIQCQQNDNYMYKQTIKKNGARDRIPFIYTSFIVSYILGRKTKSQNI